MMYWSFESSTRDAFARGWIGLMCCVVGVVFIDGSCYSDRIESNRMNRGSTVSIKREKRIKALLIGGKILYIAFVYWDHRIRKSLDR